jgi:hypothetical protein
VADCSLSLMVAALTCQEPSYSAQPTGTSVANHLICLPILHGVETDEQSIDCTAGSRFSISGPQLAPFVPVFRHRCPF